MPLRHANTAARFWLLAILLGSCLTVRSFGADTNLPVILKPVILNARPAYETDKWGVQYLVLAAPDRPYRLTYSYSVGSLTNMLASRVPLLDTNQTYTFTIATDIINRQPAFSHSMATNTRLRKIELADRVLYDIEVCEVHQIKMESKVPYKGLDFQVQVMADYRKNPPPDLATVRKFFPHPDDQLDHVHLIPVDNHILSKENLYFCPQCKTAFEKWRAEHAPQK